MIKMIFRKQPEEVRSEEDKNLLQYKVLEEGYIGNNDNKMLCLYDGP